MTLNAAPTYSSTAEYGELAKLAGSVGVAVDYWDWQGHHVTVQKESLVAVLTALGFDVSTTAAVHHSMYEAWAQRWRQMLPPCIVTQEGVNYWFWVHVPHGSSVKVAVILENGGLRSDIRQEDRYVEPQRVDGHLVGEATFSIPTDLPCGYHKLVAEGGGRRVEVPLIITPRYMGLPGSLAERKTWGFALQLYSISSKRSWGAGDLVDLADIATWAGNLGGGYLLINPLHAAAPTLPMVPSPYLPSSRRFINPIYIRVEDIPEYAYLDEGDRAAVDALRDTLVAELAEVDEVDRTPIWSAKLRALRMIHSVPRSPGRAVALRRYRDQEGVGLERFATYCALAEEYGPDFRTWPVEYRDPAGTAVAEFRREHPEDVEFHEWLQFVCDEQLAEAQYEAKNAGMSIGIMADLAVGVHPSGADAWGGQDVYAQGISVGAPPDAFNQAGQSWAQPPWRPDRLAETGYAAFRDLARTVLRHAGGLRVDHVLGLFRLWWIPEGLPPTAGTYVRYDYEALVGILTLEASRVGAILVGEDLGTVEQWVQDYLHSRGVLGTTIMWFERDYAVHPDVPLHPEQWRGDCLASVTVHDLPPTAGYLAGDHVRLRHELGLLTRSLDEELAADAGAREAWLNLLRERHLLREGADVKSTVEALHRAVTWSPARLIGVSLTDAVGDRRIQNQPGTDNEYPNWRVPMTDSEGRRVHVEDLIDNQRVLDLIRAVSGQ